MEKIKLFMSLYFQNITSVCVTNSIRKTGTVMLEQTGQLDMIDFIVANEDVENNKPHPDCYNFA